MLDNANDQCSHSRLPSLNPNAGLAFNSLPGTSNVTHENIDMGLSWNERRKMKRYQKQVEKDAGKRSKAEEREKRREEKVLAKQWKEHYKFVLSFRIERA